MSRRREIGWLGALVLSLSAASATWAQSGTPGPRHPADGPAILDCAPGDPAPENSCLLRLPLGVDYGNPAMDAIEGEGGRFNITREGLEGFPEDLRMADTVLLVDLTPGARGGRRPSFAREKDLIRTFVEGLPRGATVAVYGFNTEVSTLLPFTSDRGRILDAVDALELAGNNTLIANAVRQTIDDLAEREDVLLRHIVLVTDGFEEGGGAPLSDTVARAVEAGVTVSALGTYWLPTGTPANGTGRDILNNLTLPTGGAAAHVSLLPSQSAAAQRTVEEFAGDFRFSLERSALIVPEGAPRASLISLDLTGPDARGRDRTERARVAFEPEVPDGPAPPPAPVEDAPDLLFGFDRTLVYAVGGGLALLLLVALLVATARRGGAASEPPDEEDAFEDPEPSAPAPTPPPPPARAYLVFPENGRRVPIRGDRVTVGRSDTNEVVIDHQKTSRFHAQIHVNRDGGFSVTDLDSLNQTYVGETRVQGTAPVRLGDTVTFGKVTAKLISA